MIRGIRILSIIKRKVAHVIIMAGGTGGHVFAALALAKELMQRGYSVSWLGSPMSFETKIVPQYGIEIDILSIKRFRGKNIWRLISTPFLFGKAMFQALSIFKKREPVLVVGMGGFVSAPGGLVARLKSIPLVIHEQNIIPGLTNRLLAYIANRTCEAFYGTFPAKIKAISTGNPVRQEISTILAPKERMATHKGTLRLLVIGGSLGAEALNNLVPNALSYLKQDDRPIILHQAGHTKEVNTNITYASLGIKAKIVAFIDNMAEAFLWADLVICRSGALTISELAASGLPAILIPYPNAVDDHQTVNGTFLVKNGAALLIQQKDLDPKYLALQLKGLDRDKLLEMAICARKLAISDVDSLVADICEGEIKNGN